MFLTAVLQAHTDSLPHTDDDTRASPETDDTVQLPARLKEALAVPLQDRLLPLPSTHRARWV